MKLHAGEQSSRVIWKVHTNENILTESFREVETRTGISFPFRIPCPRTTDHSTTDCRGSHGLRGRPWITADCHGLPRITVDYRGLPWITQITADYRGLPRITRTTADYRGLRGLPRITRITADYRGLRGLPRITRITADHADYADHRGVHWSSTPYHRVSGVHRVRWSQWKRCGSWRVCGVLWSMQSAWSAVECCGAPWSSVEYCGFGGASGVGGVHDSVCDQMRGPRIRSPVAPPRIIKMERESEK